MHYKPGVIAFLLVSFTVGCSNEEQVPVANNTIIGEHGKGKYWDELPEAAETADQLLGRWKGIWHEAGDIAFTGSVGFGGIQSIEFGKSRCVLSFLSEGQRETRADCEFSIRPKRSPKELDLLGPGGCWKCIYKLAKDNRLIIRMGSFDEEESRPTCFDPTQSGGMLVVFTRIEP